MIEKKRVRPGITSALCLAWLACARQGQAQLEQGNVAAREARYEEARGAYASAALADETQARPRVLLGNTLFQLGQVAQARQAWAEALERDPASAEARLGLAQACLRARDASAALDELARIDKAHSSDADAHDAALLEALARLSRGDKGDAETALNAAAIAAKDDRHRLRGAYVMGSALLALGRYSDAQVVFEDLAKGLGGDGPYWGAFGLARLAAAQGRGTDALLHLKGARNAAGARWSGERVARDPAFAFLSNSEAFGALK